MSFQKLLEKLIGRTFPALFLEKRENGFQQALLNNQIPVLVKIENDQTGAIVRIRIKDLKNGKLYASLLPRYSAR